MGQLVIKYKDIRNSRIRESKLSVSISSGEMKINENLSINEILVDSGLLLKKGLETGQKKARGNNCENEQYK